MMITISHPSLHYLSPRIFSLLIIFQLILLFLIILCPPASQSSFVISRVFLRCCFFTYFHFLFTSPRSGKLWNLSSQSRARLPTRAYATLSLLQVTILFNSLESLFVSQAFHLILRFIVNSISVFLELIFSSVLFSSFLTLYSLFYFFLLTFISLPSSFILSHSFSFLP